MSISSSSSVSDGGSVMERYFNVATSGWPFSFIRKVSLYCMGRHRHSWRSLAIDSSEEVLPDSDEDSVFSVLFVLLGDTGLESKELDEHDERLGDGEGDGEICS